MFNEYDEYVIEAMIEAAAEREKAIAANDIHQYNQDIQILTNEINLYLRLLVHFHYKDKDE